MFVGLAGFGIPVAAQEHPKEHPKGQEHPKPGAKAGLTKDELADAITAYVNNEAAKSGGSFMVDDPVQKKKLSLTMTKVHKDRLSQLDKDTYFLCADFAGNDGATYDLDVFMKGPDKDHLQTTEVSVHKKDGVERYTWHEEGGVWKKHEAGAGKEHPAGASKEHPKEHPQTKP